MHQFPSYGDDHLILTDSIEILLVVRNNMQVIKSNYMQIISYTKQDLNVKLHTG